MFKQVILLLNKEPPITRAVFYFGTIIIIICAFLTATGCKGGPRVTEINYNRAVALNFKCRHDMNIKACDCLITHDLVCPGVL